MRKYILLLPALLAMLACEKISPLSNGLYLDGQLVYPINTRVNAYKGFLSFYSQEAGGVIFFSASSYGTGRSVWDSEFLDVVFRDYTALDDFETSVRCFQLIRNGAEETVQYYRTVSGDIVEELSLKEGRSGTFIVKDRAGTIRGTARVDVSFVLSNGEEYHLVYRGDVDTSHIESYGELD